MRGFAENTNGLLLRNLYLKTDGTSMFQINNFCLTGMLPHRSDKTTMTYDWDGSDPDSGTADGSKNNAIPPHIDLIPGGTNGFSYCVAQFFVYYAQDMDK